MSLSASDLQAFAQFLAEEPDLWRDRIRHDPSQRVYEELWDDVHVNAWLICWSEDHDTGWHDHDDAAAAIAVLSGQVREERLRLSGRPYSRVLGGGTSFYVPPSAIHRVLHAGHGPAVTLHCYSPPLRRMGAYTLGPEGELRRSPQSFEDELRAA